MTWLGAGFDHRPETAVKAHLKVTLADGPGQGTGHVESFQGQNGAGVGVIPVQVTIFVGHRENSLAIGIE